VTQALWFPSCKLTKERDFERSAQNEHSFVFGFSNCDWIIIRSVCGEKPGVFRRASCTVVRFYVAKYSAAAAESSARSKGATEAEIESARRYLGPATVQTAQSIQN
jgi:hypothetical protein